MKDKIIIGFIPIFIFIILYCIYKIHKGNKIIQKKEQVDDLLQKKAQELYNLQLIKKQIQKLQKNVQTYQDKIINLKTQKQQIQKEIDSQLNNQEIIIDTAYKNLQQHYSQAFSNYEKVMSQAYNKEEAAFEEKLSQIDSQRTQAENELNQIIGLIKAATAARQRQKLEKEKIKFYQIQLSPHQISDIQKLQALRSTLFDSTIVSKLIWSAFVMKATTDMCNRVLGKNTICGIYKITNQKTGQVYIGQSLDIATRWKNHIKSGLGIDASSTNKFYNNMQETGVWNFTFEVLQECSRDLLNEKERFWIQTYESNISGLNTQRGTTSSHR